MVVSSPSFSQNSSAQLPSGAEPVISASVIWAIIIAIFIAIGAYAAIFWFVVYYMAEQGEGTPTVDVETPHETHATLASRSHLEDSRDIPPYPGLESHRPPKYSMVPPPPPPPS